MSVILGIIAIISLYLAGGNKKFYYVSIACVIMFLYLVIFGNNKFESFVFFFFTTGLTQIFLTAYKNLKEKKI